MPAKTNSYNKGEAIGHRYRLERRLGQGGMGEVWLAEDVDGNRPPVALKLLLEPDTAHRNRFYEEARAHRNLTHANIVEMYGFEDPLIGSPYLVTEYMPGGSLDRLLEAARARPSVTSRLPSGLSRDLVLSLLVQVADALEHMHALGYAHRDLKTSNLLLKEPLEVVLETQQATLKLADLGIVDSDSSVRPELTRTGAFVGSFQYSAPEYLKAYLEFHQRRAKSHATLDRTPEDAQRGDIFALGLIFFELWMGERFFSLDQKTLIKRQVRENVDLARETQEALLKALEQLRREPPASISSDEEALGLLRALLNAGLGERPTAEQVKQRGQALRSTFTLASVSTFSGSRSGDEPPSRAVGAPARRSRGVLAAAAALLMIVVGISARYAGILEAETAPSQAPLNPEPDDSPRGQPWKARQVPKSRPLPGSAPSPAAGKEAGPSGDGDGSGGEDGSAPEVGQGPSDTGASPRGSASVAMEAQVPDLPDELPDATEADREFARLYLHRFRGPVQEVQGTEELSEGKSYVQFVTRSRDRVLAPAPGKRGRVIQYGWHPENGGNRTVCVTLEHSPAYWSLICGMRWESMPGKGHEYEAGEPLGPRADASGKVTLRLFGSKDPSAVGEPRQSQALDTGAWLDPKFFNE